MRLILFSVGLTGWLIFATAGWSQDELPAGGASPPAAAGQPPAVQQGQQPRGAQPQAGQAQPAAATDAEYRQQVSYALGRNFAQNLQANDIELDLESLVAGLTDALKNAPPKWTDQQLEPTMRRFSQEMEQKALTRMRQQATKNKQEAEAFLAQNAKREGVQTTPSGLQYRVIRAAEGPSPTMGDTVRVNYRGTLLNGTEFDSSARHGGPAEFRIAPGLIQGWIEALQKMKVGEKWQLFVPPQLAYGTEPPGPPIEPNSLLAFEIELLDIVQE